MSPPADDAPKQVRTDCKTLHEVARRFSPVVRFHEQERFFPVLAESWLTHTTEAPWADDPGHFLGDLAPDGARRGAALLEQVDGQLKVLAGPPLGGNRPIQLTTDDSDPYAIGRRDLRQATDQMFLDLAGWLPASGLSQGDLDRLYALFSELSAAVNQSLDWLPLAGSADLPHAWVQQPVNPTTYCEVTAAGRFHSLSDRLEKELGRADFPPGDDSLDQFVAFTYHYLYPAKEPGPDGNGPRLEGQWEAVTLFFRGEGFERDGGMLLLPPEHVVVSQGIDPVSGDRHHTEERPWSQVTKLGEHPVVYAAKGSHHFFFEPVGGVTGTPPSGGTNPPGTDPGTHDDDRHEGGVTDLLLLGLILLALAALIVAALLLIGVAIIAAIVIAIALIILALWALFEWLKSLFDSGDNDSSGDPVPGGSGNDEAGDDGTQAGGEEDPGPAAGGGDDGGGGAVGSGGSGSVGLPGSGSPTGKATVSFDVRLVDRLHPHDRTTPYPSDDLCENPTWWDYSGRWGVRVMGGFGSGWQHGTRRVDEYERSWAYWNGLRLSTVLHGGSRQG